MNIIRPLTLVTLAIGLVLPAGALGAAASMKTISVEQFDFKGGPGVTTTSTVTYAAAGGEANAPVFIVSPDGALTISDPAAGITPGEGCSDVGAGQVRCAPPASAILRLEVALGDGDDVLAGFDRVNWSVSVDAGPGADVVELFEGTAKGGQGDDVMRGVRQSVSLFGDAGADVITGGPANDSIAGGLGSDRLDGGDGNDSVGWGDETLAVTVDLASPGPAGSAAEPDDVRNFEHASGGQGDDVLRGTDAANQLSGGGGDDLLEGRGGGDALDGGSGADRVLGGAGNDELVNGYVAGGERDTLEGQAGNDVLRNLASGSIMRGGAGSDTLEFDAGARLADGETGDDHLEAFELDRSTAFIRCGRGRDRLSGLEGDALVPRDCETMELLGPGDVDGPSVSTRVTLRGGLLRVPLPLLCDVAKRCPMRVAVRASGTRVLARASRTLVLPTGQSVAIRLSARARRLILREGRVRLDFSSREALRPFAIRVRVR